ncbi:AMP-binding protein [Geobacter pelophilus]|uniref:AMP-binding protein n=1 Tax=Geoanaerobacter pelophilus TaxID=60036 RepID=A0AAW4KZU2_9BACT|nr:fatty acid CoA ligase family protein [Geoanaerobacter pelophilus]MBT0664309.1 AMP-binding protein [Geoanaerobacter pelophilus]
MPRSDIINIARPLTALAQSQPDTPAIVFPQENRTLTFRELDAESDRLAAGLSAIGIKRGVRTALLVPPSPELFALTFALFKSGAVPVFIDPGIGAKNMKGCLENAEPSAFIGVPKAHLARRLLGWGKATLQILVTVNGGKVWGGVPLDEIRRSVSDLSRFEPIATRRDETAAILFTSGSTGTPKGAVYSHGNFAAQVEALRQVYDITPGEIDLPTFPLFALFAPALGMTAIIPQMDFTRPGSVNPKRIIGPATRFKTTTMFGSPALLNRVGRYGKEKGLKLPALKRVISAGAPVSPAILERFSALLPDDAEIFTPYGATEALPVCSIGSREILGETRRITDAGGGVCVGRPVDGIRLEIIGISDEPIPTWDDSLRLPLEKIGEIIVQGPQVTSGYFNRPEADRLSKIADPATGGFFHRMGDLGGKDDQGRIWFCGRKAHRVETGYETLFTIPCEAVFNTHPAVFRSALVGVGAKGHQRPVICIELERGGKSSREQIRKELREIALAHLHTQGIDTFLFHPAFPVDIRHNAKIFREKLAVWAARKLK